MRSSLYIRDDDYRYSFLYGNFVTLTNLNERDWERLEEQRLSPLYVSVHATELEMRRILLGNNRAPDIMRQFERLFALGIRVHTQVVTCPGMNDGEVLESQRLKARLGEMLLERELLEAKIAALEARDPRPLARPRSRR